MVDIKNTGYYEKGESQAFITRLGKHEDLETKLKSLSPKDRELIKLACKAAKSKDGIKTSIFTTMSTKRIQEEGLSSLRIGDRFLEVTKKMNEPTVEQRESTTATKILKGIGNLFGRSSSASLHSKIKKLNIE